MKNVLPFRGNDILRYSITYDLVTPESAKEGSYEESGFEVETTEGELSDILKQANFDYGIYQPVGVGVYVNPTPDHDKDYFEKGHEKYYTLHITHTDNTKLNQEQIDFITALLNEGKYHYDEEDNRFYEWGGTPEYGIGGWIGGTLIGGFLGYQVGKAVGYGRAYRGYEGGGQITEGEYSMVVNHWVYFTFNYPSGFLDEAFGTGTIANHLKGKFSSYYEKYGSNAVMPKFYSELDNENRRLLCDFVKNNYVNSKEQFVKIKSISDEEYCKIVNHWTMFGFNYPYGWLSNVFQYNTDHYSSKFSRAYDRAGSIGAMNYFYTELDGGNQQKLTEWVMKNYSGTKLEQGGSTYSNGGEIKKLIKDGVLELEYYQATDEHVKEYGLKSQKALYLKNFCVNESHRLKGVGKKALAYLDNYAKENGYDVIFGYVAQKGSFTKDDRLNYFCDVDLIKNWLKDNGYAINQDNNDFHKVISGSTYAKGGGESYGLGGLLLAGGFGAYVGYKIGRARPQKKGFDTEKKIARKVKSKAKELTSKKKPLKNNRYKVVHSFNYSNGGGVDIDLNERGEHLVIGIENLKKVLNQLKSNVEFVDDRNNYILKDVTDKGFVTDKGLYGWKNLDDRHTEKDGIMLGYNDFQDFFYFKLTDEERAKNPYGFYAEKMADLEDRLRDTEEEGYLFAGGGGVEDWMEKAIESLREETGFDDLEISNESSNEFYATNGDAEYMVFEKYDDAYDYAVERVSEDLAESPEYFNQDWLYNQVDENSAESILTDIFNEQNMSYATDIMMESDNLYPNRLIAEMVEAGIMDEEDATSDDAIEISNDYMDEFVSYLTQNQIEDGRGGLENYELYYGKEETMNFIIENGLIDIREASINAVEQDGVAHFISSYDGNEIQLEGDSVAYRIN